jgi:molybdate transport system regulatory protein
MKISARNVLAGTVKNVTKGAVNAEVALALAGGETVVAIITNHSVDSLGLREGGSASAIIKASEVMIGKGVENAKLSARNVLTGEVARLEPGAVNSEVEIRLSGGTPVVASITKASANALDLKQGDKVSAIVKASNVLVGIGD